MKKPSTGVAEDADVHDDVAPADAVTDRDLERELLDPDGGGGAELRGHVPDDPQGVVLVLHGGAEDSHAAVAWWRLAVIRMAPFAAAVEAAPATASPCCA